MSYNLVYTRKAVKDIQNIDSVVKERIGKTLLRYKEDPLKYARKMINSDHGSYRFRIGDYRVIFDLEKDDIVVLRIGHRKEIYKK
jgi:mRNA interferase RelE/StbE